MIERRVEIGEWHIGLPYCTECGGNLNWDRKLRQYSCESCGMTFTEAELSEARDRLYENREDEDEIRGQRHRDYLDWWLSDKSKNKR